MDNDYKLQPTYHSTKPFDWGLIDCDRLRNPLSGDGPQHPADDFSNVYRMIWAVWRTGNVDKERNDLSRNLNMLREFSMG